MTKKRPTLFTTLGFPGSGKTHFAERLSKKLGFFHLSSDRLRLEMFPQPTYTATEHGQVFQVMDYITSELLANGVSVIYDANSTKRVYRRRLQNIAKRNKAGYVLLYLETPVDIALSRISNRGDKVRGTKKKYYRNINPEVLHKLKDEIELPDKRESTIYVDGTISFSEQLKKLQSGLHKI